MKSIMSSSVGEFISHKPALYQILFSGALSGDEQLRLIDAHLENNRTRKKIEEHFVENKAAFRALAVMPGRIGATGPHSGPAAGGISVFYIDCLTQLRQEILEEKQTTIPSDGEEYNK